MRAPQWVPGGTSGSKARNLASFTFALFGGLFAIEIIWPWFHVLGLTPTNFTTGVFAIFGFGYFALTTLGVLLLRSNNFIVAPGRLVRDVAISIGYSIVAFALFYRTAGIVPTYSPAVDPSSIDHIYFSVVTFSTLGYGDFRPSEAARMMAAAQAILGTIHIGMIVGAAFLAVSQQPSGNNHSGDSNNGSDDQK